MRNLKASKKYPEYIINIIIITIFIIIITIIIIIIIIIIIFTIIIIILKMTFSFLHSWIPRLHGSQITDVTVSFSLLLF